MKTSILLTRFWLDAFLHIAPPYSGPVTHSVWPVTVLPNGTRLLHKFSWDWLNVSAEFLSARWDPRGTRSGPAVGRGRLWQWCSAEAEAVHTEIYSHHVSAIHQCKHSPSVLSFFLTAACMMSCFYCIVMAECIFLVSCMAEVWNPPGRWGRLFFVIHIIFGSAVCNDFLIPLFRFGS